MPKDVQYIGNADKATITEEQFKAANQSNQTVTWHGHGTVQSVNNEAADHLIKTEPKRFAEAGTVAVKGSPDNGDDSGEDDGKADASATTSGSEESSGSTVATGKPGTRSGSQGV